MYNFHPGRKAFCTAVLVFWAIISFQNSAMADTPQDRTGAWVDEVIAIREDRGAAYALQRLLTGDSHVYAYGITDNVLYDRIRSEESLDYELHLGTSSELSFNPSGPVFERTGELNPFAVPRVREAMNYLVDRAYIADEIYGGMARPRWLPINSAFPDYARLVDVARMLEHRYAHAPEEAESMIREEMEKLGAELRIADAGSARLFPAAGLSAFSLLIALALAILAFMVFLAGLRRGSPGAFVLCAALILGAIVAIVIPYAYVQRRDNDARDTRVERQWYYEDRPVVLRFLIRIEDERRQVGDYVAGLLEEVGFRIERQYRTASEASPIWSGGDPADGRFHIYTGAWISPIVRRDDTGTFDFFYTSRGLPSPLWQAFSPSEEFDDVSERLSRRDFESLEERNELFARALELSLEDSVRIWLVDQINISPRRREVSVAADLGGGISGAYLWPHTLRIGDEVGGRVRIAVPELLPDPWNPLDGSNWIYDMMFTRATSDYGALIDPYTGLSLPQRIERGEIVVVEGLPVQKTHDWVSLEFADVIDVPPDAWVDWDAAEQRFITVGEKYPDGLTARRKSTAYYPEGLDETLWHDGSRFSPADIVLGMILTFDRASEESKLYDEAQVDAFESFQRHFRGMRIRSRSPLIIETYSHSYSLDAENNVSTWYPAYQHGPGAWHVLALGMLAEKSERLAFSNFKADRLEVEWMSMVAGPSIGILGAELEKAAQQNYIPFSTVLGDYVDAGEASRRWHNLREWYESRGHFWVGTGPFYLQRVHPVEKTLHLRRFEDYPDPAGKWQRFEDPMIPEVDLSGPRTLSPGGRAEFDVHVSYAGRPYDAEHIQSVVFLWYDAARRLVMRGDAEPVEDGRWRISLSEADTADLGFGPNRIEVAVVSELVSIPVLESIEFVVRP